jgi:hypothetical protein
MDYSPSKYIDDVDGDLESILVEYQIEVTADNVDQGISQDDVSNISPDITNSPTAHLQNQQV